MMQFYPTEMEKVLVKKISDGYLYPCSELVREQANQSAELLPGCMADTMQPSCYCTGEH